MTDYNDITHSGYSNLRVELCKLEPEPYRLIWRWFRETWESLHGQEYDSLNPEHVTAVKDVCEGRALPTPLEQLSVEFRVSGLSRVALAQITRGRVGWAYNVLSQMPAPITHAITVPLNVDQDEKFGPRARELARLTAELYDEMIEAGVPPQDCRYLVLHGQQTSITCGTNYAALKGFFMMRAESGLCDELSLVARLLRAEIQRKSLESGFEGWASLVSRLDCLGAHQGKTLITDRVFGATGRFPPGSPQVSVPEAESGRFPLNPIADYDFSKSAWFLELQRLPESLLFPGELEMVERWKRGGTLLP